jgi:acyl carrier protein
MTSPGFAGNGIEEQAFGVVRRHLKFLNTAEPLRPDASLRDLGLNSLAAIDLMLDLEQTFAIVFPDEELTEQTFRTAGGIAAAVARVAHKTRGP